MALDSYTGLKTSIQTWIARADLSGDVDDMIDLFEAWFNRNIRVPQMEQESNAFAAEYLALPADFLELRDVQYQGSPVIQLEYVTPTMADIENPFGDSLTPRWYTIVANQIRLVPVPDDSTVNVRIDYWQKLPALSSIQTSNWLLAAYPDAYLYGTLVHGHVRVADPQLATFIAAGWQSVMKELQGKGRQHNVGSLLRVRYN